MACRDRKTRYCQIKSPVIGPGRKFGFGRGQADSLKAPALTAKIVAKNGFIKITYPMGSQSQRAAVSKNINAPVALKDGLDNIDGFGEFSERQILECRDAFVD